ncbi:(E2-independent) E3 ubiquitin-conjugating enzyme FATS isoform X8 [Fukomys damarensis]|uniref:(E2-independent) E3 ubiquitin-conjugating enzyme FATS isoform X8 n=1 Tax=Fukomys damarensis TaxID=885580 RepID=UPI00053FE1DC|nr:(E2-independent) E3 ubiquitin-conjugating enzyme FATS isoform X8 [Fukomys damarensis]
MALKSQWTMVQLFEEGLQDNHYSAKDQISFRNLQSGVTERKSDFTKETLASQNTKMISSIVISQLIDENKSKENVAALPLPCGMMAQPGACRTNTTSPHSSGVNIHRVFASLPDKLGIPTSSDERRPAIDLPPSGNRVCGPHQGFASITITARRVGPLAGALVRSTVGDSLCPKYGAEGALRWGPSARAGGPHPRPHCGPLACTEFPKKGSAVRVKVPEAYARRYTDHEYWVTCVDSKNNSFSPDTQPSGKDPLVFSSCVHLWVSRQCPNSIYYLDRSLAVPVEQPQIVSPQMHRSVLSLNLSCSSHGLTADGVDGLANGEPISRALKQEVLEGNQNHLGSLWNPALPASHSEENPLRLGTGTCPWSDCPPRRNTEIADVGNHQVTVRKGKGHPATRPASGHGNQLSIHIPGWSHKAGDYTCCDLVVKIKECKKSEDSTMPEVSPAPPSPTSLKGPVTPGLSEDSPDPQETPASLLTLQEALEVHKPQFISHSQERLKKLEHMVQQRKAQRKESPGQKQSLLPVRANKKQFTIPHPLSDNLFKPKERCISEKEMHMRSKRIYNNLPEVKKKKEEQKKRVILQSNRLRAEVFKKQLLDQLLQRNAV